MGDRYNQIKRIAEIFSTTRYKSGYSQEYMAAELGVSKKTIQNWEKGTSCPSLLQVLDWFDVIGENPTPYIMSCAYPNEIKKNIDASNDKEINKIFKKTIESLPAQAKKGMIYLFCGNHGSSPEALLQLTLAHIHLPMRDRLAPAVIVAQMYKMEESLGNLVCTEDIMPNMDILERAIMNAKDAVQKNNYGYFLKEKDSH